MNKRTICAAARERINVKPALKILLDLGMTVLIFVLMSYQYTTQKNHEIFGAAMLTAFLLHQALNISWYKSLFKGKYSKQRILMLVVDGAILLVMLALMISGIGMSRYVFCFMNVQMSAALARQFHMVTSFLLFLLTGFHIGLHALMLCGVLCKILHKPKPHRLFTLVMKTLLLITAVYGAYAVYKREFLKYITLQNHFLQFDYTEPVIFYLSDLLAIFIFTASLGYMVKKALNKTQNKRKGDLL